MRFTRLKIGQNETKQLTVKNGINEPSIIGTVAKPFSFVSLEEITGEFPASSTIYFRENFVLQNVNGEFATTEQGYGIAGITDENSKFTPSYAMPSIENLATDPESPMEATDFTISCDTNIPDGEYIIFEYQLQSGGAWTSLGTAQVVGGVCELSGCQIPTAGAYYIRAVYGAEVVVSASISVTVESGAYITRTLSIDATCSASVPKTLINTIETQSMDATCSASVPEAI